MSDPLGRGKQGNEGEKRKRRQEEEEEQGKEEEEEEQWKRRRGGGGGGGASRGRDTRGGRRKGGGGATFFSRGFSSSAVLGPSSASTCLVISALTSSTVAHLTSFRAFPRRMLWLKWYLTAAQDSTAPEQPCVIRCSECCAELPGSKGGASHLSSRSCASAPFTCLATASAICSGVT